MKFLRKIDRWLTPPRRHRLYGVTMPVIAILVTNGVLSESDAANVGLAIAALLGVGTLGVARRNVPKNKTKK